MSTKLLYLTILATVCGGVLSLLPSKPAVPVTPSVPSASAPATVLPINATTPTPFDYSFLTPAQYNALGINNYLNGFSNTACETNPTNLLCNTSVAVGHEVIKNLPAPAVIRHCNVFLASPHCCGQFCQPGTGGICDAATGACFCNPSGVPNVCQLQTTTSPNMNQNDRAVVETCRGLCRKNTNNCTEPAAATDGIVGTVCMCYCPS